MEYEEIDLIKQSENGIVQLIREKDGGHLYIRKVIKGQHSVYLTLQGCRHFCLPELYEVTMTGDTTTIIEEYIEGQSLGRVKLSKKQFLGVVKDLCAVLEFLHNMGIIHRDIKPSNIIYAGDGHVRLIDFDAARVPKDNQEQDTRLLGTRGYAPPEQYGFSQTDERTDIYSFGVTLEQILQNKVQRLRYKRIIRKCTELDPDKRYQSIRQVKKAFFHTGRSILCGIAVLVLVLFFSTYIYKSNVADFESAVALIGNRSMEDFDRKKMKPESTVSLTPSERYPNQILWRDFPVREYLGRYIDDVIDEMDEPYDEYIDSKGNNICSYMEIGIVFCFDDKRKIDLVIIDPALSTYNGEWLDVNKEKLLDLLGDPVFAGWSEKQFEDTEKMYYMDYYDIDTKEGAVFYMPSPEEGAEAIYID